MLTIIDVFSTRYKYLNWKKIDLKVGIAIGTFDQKTESFGLRAKLILNFCKNFQLVAGAKR